MGHLRLGVLLYALLLQAATCLRLADSDDESEILPNMANQILGIDSGRNHSFLESQQLPWPSDGTLAARLAQSDSVLEADKKPTITEADTAPAAGEAGERLEKQTKNTEPGSPPAVLDVSGKKSEKQTTNTGGGPDRDSTAAVDEAGKRSKRQPTEDEPEDEPAVAPPDIGVPAGTLPPRPEVTLPAAPSVTLPAAPSVTLPPMPGGKKEQDSGANGGRSVALGVLLLVIGGVAVAFMYMRCRSGPDIIVRDLPGTQEEDDDYEWPGTLMVTSSHGYAGNYHMVSGRRPNGYPLWKHESSNDWIFCSTSNQWLIGDDSEEAVNFECETGNIASHEVHAGRMPDEMGPGGWLFFDGKGWKLSPDINITSEYFTLADQEATQDKQNSSAVLIQANFKGRRDRKKVAEMRQNKDARRASAASRISATFRGKKEREKLAEELEASGKPAPKALKKAGLFSRATSAFSFKGKKGKNAPPASPPSSPGAEY